MKRQETSPNIDDLQTLTAEQVAYILQVSEKTLKRYCRQGVFPQPIPNMVRLRRWSRSVVAEFLSNNPHPTLSDKDVSLQKAKRR